MDENLAEGVILSLCANQMRVSTRHRSVIPQVVRWTRNQSAVIMELNNGNISVFFKGAFIEGAFSEGAEIQLSHGICTRCGHVVRDFKSEAKIRCNF